MKIFLDIGHPAHVHYFRNFIKAMEVRGHTFLVTAREREHVAQLLNYYNIAFISRGKGGHSLPAKIWYLLLTAWRQYWRARRFRPDVFLDFSTIYSGAAAWILNKPYITFTDTEPTGVYRMLIRPFSKVVYTPHCFTKDLGKQHQRFNGLMELAYLHPRYFEPDPAILKQIGLADNEKFAIVRFVEWGAVHDRGRQGISQKYKAELVETLRQHARVFISAEGPLPDILEPLRLNMASHQMHNLLFYATLLVGESATMTTEAAILGTPAIFVSDFRLGNLLYLENNYGLVLNFQSSNADQKQAIKEAEMLMARPDSKSGTSRQSEKILDDHIDVTQFIINTVLDLQ
jgi:predicted glycosyltransferase